MLRSVHEAGDPFTPHLRIPVPKTIPGKISGTTVHEWGVYGSFGEDIAWVSQACMARGRATAEAFGVECGVGNYCLQ